MATKKQASAARKNIRKAQAKWKSMTKRQHALSQPQGRMRRKPGTTGAGKFYRIGVRPKSEFTSFRTQDVGKRGGLERVAGRRSSGSWATAVWLVSKEKAHVSKGGMLVIDDPKERASIAKATRGPIRRVKGDIFSAHPAKNVPEASKPTPAMRRAQKANLAKARKARRAR